MRWTKSLPLNEIKASYLQDAGRTGSQPVRGRQAGLQWVGQVENLSYPLQANSLP
jgi:hypothetical protein